MFLLFQLDWNHFRNNYVFRTNRIPLYGAALSASTPYTAIDYSPGAAIAVGTEATGLTQDFLTVTEQNIIIPMTGEIDSMNVSVSAAIIIFEAKKTNDYPLV